MQRVSAIILLLAFGAPAYLWQLKYAACKVLPNSVVMGCPCQQILTVNAAQPEATATLAATVASPQIMVVVTDASPQVPLPKTPTVEIVLAAQPPFCHQLVLRLPWQPPQV
ncbi:MAG: hypothetical protein EAY75_02670 [Bacteroidetes bacterium]|nr:MAG: hypothetical protein EAY75_02670 [Bacteroidota bacterium]